MTAYYNENDPYAAQWLRNLIAANLIAPGEVDDRSIKDVRPDDLRGFTQCHFFAGIGGWSRALRLAGWSDDRAVWTGSCPCQPFAVGGNKKGFDDARHLWPDFYRLITELAPSIVFGEQVASTDGRLWFTRVRTDMEALGYAAGCADLCAAGVSAPHVRQRLYWVADAAGERWREECQNSSRQHEGNRAQGIAAGLDSNGSLSGVANANGYHEHWWSSPMQVGRSTIKGTVTRGGRQYSAQWRIEPGVPLLAHGIPGRVGQLCGLGNAIVPQLAAEFIQAYEEAT